MSMEIIEETHVHIKSGNRYDVFGYGKVQIHDVWHDAVFYMDSSSTMYCREKKDFDIKFKPIQANLKPSNSGELKNDFIIMPEHINMHNACNERCDMLIGPCACGAWHKLKDWEDRIPKKEIENVLPEPNMFSNKGKFWKI